MKIFALCLAVLLVTGGSARAATSVDVAIQTSLGTIVVRIDTLHAPRTAKNFLKYVDDGTYNGTSFYRTVSKAKEPQSAIEVIQGGLHGLGAPKPRIALEPTSQTGLHNTDGAMSMARTSNPDSANTEFFLCIGDNRFLDAGGAVGPGYAAFGKVIRGADIVRKIQNSPSEGETLTPPIRIIKMTRVR